MIGKPLNGRIVGGQPKTFAQVLATLAAMPLVFISAMLGDRALWAVRPAERLLRFAGFELRD